MNKSKITLDEKWNMWLEQKDTYLPPILEKEYTKKEVVITNTPLKFPNHTWFYLDPNPTKVIIAQLFMFLKNHKDKDILVRGQGAELVHFFFPKKPIFIFKSKIVINEKKPLFCNTDLTFNTIRKNHNEASEMLLNFIDPDFTIPSSSFTTSDVNKSGYLNFDVPYKMRNFMKNGTLIRFGERSDIGSEYGSTTKKIYGTMNSHKFKIKSQQELETYNRMNNVSILLNVELFKNLIKNDKNKVKAKYSVLL